MTWYQDESSEELFSSLNHNQTKPDAMWVDAVAPASLALDCNESSPRPSCPIVSCSIVGWCVLVDVGWYQDGTSASLFPSLNHDQTRPYAMWGVAVTLESLALDRNR